MIEVRVGAMGTAVRLRLPDDLQHYANELFVDYPVRHQAELNHISITIDPTPPGYRVSGGGPSIVVDDQDTALCQVLNRMNAAAIDGAPYFGVHAGVVAIGERAIALPAASGIGKSTLVAACVQRGMAYVSDEALFADWVTGVVVPYPRPISLSSQSCELLGLNPTCAPETAFTPAQLEATVAERPLHLAHIILLNTSNDPLMPMPRSEGLVALLRRSFNHWKDPTRAFDLAHELVSGASVWRMGRAAPAAAAARIADLLV